MKTKPIDSENQLLPVGATPTQAPVTHQPPRWVEPLREPSIRLGLGLVAALALLSAGYDYWRLRTGLTANMPVFFIHYAAAIGYTIYGLMGRWLRFRFWKQPAAGLPQRLILLIIWLLSCFALNREMAVFQASTPWLSVVLVIIAGLMLAVGWFEQMTVRAQQGLVLGLSAACWLFVYQSIYIAPIYHISLVGLLLLGISMHAFIPLIITVTLGKWLKHGWQNEHLRLPIGLGLALPVVVVAVFVGQWARLDAHVRYTLNEAQTRADDDLPDWVRLAQQLKPGWLTDKWLYANDVYDQRGWWTGMGRVGRLTEATRLHDPLVLIAALLVPPLDLAAGDRTKLIAVVNDARPETAEHLWTGRDLRVTNVTSQVRIYPDYRLAYTEKTLMIQNRNEQLGPQEAVFTGQLPAGSVVSSLSLWVNGLEEKGVLTTEAKADTVYRKVVGVESRRATRDPSVVRWLEGNRVLLRVFPCVSGQMRQVKIGITSPLRLENGALVYDNPTFEGPTMQQATETVKLDFTQMPTGLTLPDFLKPTIFGAKTGTVFQHDGDYKAEWSVRLKAPALATAGFSLDGQTYTVAPLQPKTEPFDPASCYLDVNQSWTRPAFDAVLKAVGQRPVWVYDEALVLLTPANRDALFDRLTRQRFSLFPIYCIPNPATALLITKSDANGPQLAELTGSAFARRLSREVAQRAPLRLFSLSTMAPVFQTMTALNAVLPTMGNPEKLASLLTSKQFTALPDTDGAMALPQAGMVIKRDNAQGPQPTLAPDHLARLFAYQHLLHQIGRQYFTRHYLTDALISEAQHANVVSPISGLLVLETQADYDRFKIKRDTNGLDNATLKNQGAVPEPHEWALLLLLATLVGWVWRKGGVMGGL